MTGLPTARPQPRWDLVALAVRYRREQLGYGVDQLAAHVGVSADAWRTLEAGSRPSGFRKEQASTASAALDWTADSLDRIVRGQRPLDAPGALPTLAPSGRVDAVRAAPVESPKPAAPGKSAPWFLAPICTKGPAGVRAVDPARLGVLGGLVIMVAVIVVFFAR
jgi:hypothetical protein